MSREVAAQVNKSRKRGAAWIFLCIFLCGFCGCSRKTEPVQIIPAETTAVTETILESTPETQTEVLPMETEAAAAPRVRYKKVPHYFQTDYPYYKLGNGTIASSGCSMTCLAMVASFLTDHTYTPDQMAYHFGSYGKNYVERLDYGSEQMELPVEKVFDWRLVRAGLEEGKVAIVMVSERSPFTTEQHFLVAAGLNEQGKVIVNDPAGWNYANPDLEYGFTNGFEDYSLTKGFSGAWIYDKAAMPENPFCYDASMPEQPETRYFGYNFPEEDAETLARFACAAAGSQSQQVQQAVLETILNRLYSDIYPNTVDKVIYNSELWVYGNRMNNAQPDEDTYQAVHAAVYGPHILPMEVVNFIPGYAYGPVWGMVENYSFLYDEF